MQVTYPQLFLFYNENKAFIEVGIKVSHFYTCLLLLSNPFSFSVQKFDFYIGI